MIASKILAVGIRGFSFVIPFNNLSTVFRSCLLSLSLFAYLLYCVLLKFPPENTTLVIKDKRTRLLEIQRIDMKHVPSVQITIIRIRIKAISRANSRGRAIIGASKHISNSRRIHGLRFCPHGSWINKSRPSAIALTVAVPNTVVLSLGAHIDILRPDVLTERQAVVAWVWDAKVVPKARCADELGPARAVAQSCLRGDVVAGRPGGGDIGAGWLRCWQRT